MILHMAVDVSGSAELAALISRIEAVRDVVSVRRIATSRRHRGHGARSRPTAQHSHRLRDEIERTCDTDHV